MLCSIKTSGATNSDTTPSPGQTLEAQFISLIFYLRHSVRGLLGLHSLLVVGPPTETYLKGWGFPILLQLSHH